MSNSSVTVYESSFCPYCMWAKRLLDDRGIHYETINVDRNREKWSEMEKISGRSTVPQIFFGEHHVGGFDDLSTMDRNGELDQLLASGW